MRELLSFVVISIVCSVIMCINYGCGYQLDTDINQKKICMFKNGRAIILDSYNQFHPIIQAIKIVLHSHHILMYNNFGDISRLDTNKQIPRLKIINVLENHITVSVFQNGSEAEYQLTVQIHAELFNSSKDYTGYPIHIYVNRIFICDPGHALSNAIQEKEIRKEMYQDAAQQLINQIMM